MKANISNRWKHEARNLVREHDFALDTVIDSGARSVTCDFCGSHLRYVAVIKDIGDGGISKNVGLNCLEHALGSDWSYLLQAKQKMKHLKKRAKIERRKKNYAEKFSDIIDWLEQRPNLVSSNNFFASMYNSLVEGSKDFTSNMERAMRSAMASSKYLKKDDRHVAEKNFKPLLEKIERVRELVMLVDGVSIIGEAVTVEAKRSDWKFVDSVYQYAKSNCRASEKQLKALNKIYAKYQKMFDARFEQEDDYSDIPF